MINVLTIDLEEWFHANYEDRLFDNERNYENRVESNTERLLNLFDTYKAKATFFTLGFIAEKYPELVRRIHEKGHEIASHGYGHQLVYKQSPEEFEEDLLQSVHYIERAIGTRPIGYRAPSWSVQERTSWVYPILKKHGFRYDASIFPIHTYLYGIPDAPRWPFQLEFTGGSILEFPTSTARIAGCNIPFSGGFYFRFFPYPLIKHWFRSLNRRQKPVIFYLHPREIDLDQPRLEGLKQRDSFIHYYQIAACESKLRKLLIDFEFCTAEQFFFKSGWSPDSHWNIERSSPLPASAGNSKTTISG